MTTSSDLPTPLLVRRATASDRPALEQLWHLFRHDQSPYSGELPGTDGGYRRERLDQALADLGAQTRWQSWLLTAGGRPIGLALCRAMDEPVRVLSSLFVVRNARGAGLGAAFARRVVVSTPGCWAVAHQSANTGAGRFWDRLAAALDPDRTIEPLPVPDRPDLPPDVWVRFTVACNAGSCALPQR